MTSADGGRRREVVEFFRAVSRPLTAREVADELGLHINTARFHLDALVRQGLLRREEGQSHGPGRPRIQYIAVPGMDRGGPRNYKLLAEMLLSHFAAEPDASQAAIEVGRDWGRYLVQPLAPGQRISPEEGLARVIDLLADTGFQPQSADIGDGGTDIRLRHCPFLELAEIHRELVCAMHLGLLRGAFEVLRTPLQAETLIPFADPHTCVAHLRPAPGSDEPGAEETAGGA